MKFVYNPKFIDISKLELAKEKIECIKDKLENTTVVCWGDGAFLHYVREENDCDAFFPIWLWTRNFLMNSLESLDFSCISDIEEVEMNLLKVKVTTSSWFFEDEAFNDVYLNVTQWRMGYLNLIWENIPTREVKGDWIIVCTPQGSTWYNVNAWGVILPLGHNIIWITDINSTDKKSVVVDSQKIEINPFRWNFTCFVDSRKYENAEKVEILGYSRKIKVLYLKNNNFEKSRYE